MSLRLVVPCLLALALVACSDSEGGSAPADATPADADLPSFDTSVPVDAAADAMAPGDAADDAAVPDAAVEPDTAQECRTAGCPCQDNGDCLTGVCIETAGGPICAAHCAESCPDGFVCRTVSGTGSDLVSVCVPAFPRLCEPCQTDGDCAALGGATTACVAYGAGGSLGSFCGGACSDQEPCPEGFECALAKTAAGGEALQCRRKDLQCPCDFRAVKLQLATACSQGACKGKRTCTAAGLTACDAPLAITETCNGGDDDCDGQTDEPGPGVCADGNPCTADDCTAGQCPHPPASGPCDDGDACTLSSSCSGGACVGSGSLACDDGNPCTADTCAAASGCQHPPLVGPCDDGDACTISDFCAGSTCQGGPAPQCDDANGCTADGCEPASGCTNLPAAATCTDQNACTVGDQCQAGACAAGAKLACDDQEACTFDACDPQAGCAYVSLEGKPCDDGNACTGAGACAAGTCAPGPAVTCDDGQACTADACDSAKGCLHVSLDGKSCDDGNACTGQDACQAGACQGGAAVACDDAKPCTTDACSAVFGCVHAGTAAPCDDGNACTVGDGCAGDQCAGGPAKACSDGDPCTTDACDAKQGCVFTPSTGSCDDGSACTAGDVCTASGCAGQPIACQDGNACTADECEPKSGCQFKFQDGAACDDGTACTTGDECEKGKCISVPLACADSNPCTDDGCNAQTGCTHVANSAACSDGDACTEGDACQQGKCCGQALVCDDGNLCTDDGCDSKSGCSHAQNTKACPDADACTTGEVCAQGACTKAAVSCDDANPCTQDSCDSATGCKHVAVANETACGSADWCQSGQCVAKPVTKTFNTQNFNGMTGYPLDFEACKCCSPTTTQQQMDAFCVLAGYKTAVTWTVQSLQITTCYCWGGCSGYKWQSNCCSGLQTQKMVTSVTCKP